LAAALVRWLTSRKGPSYLHWLLRSCGGLCL